MVWRAAAGGRFNAPATSVTVNWLSGYRTRAILPRWSRAVSTSRSSTSAALSSRFHCFNRPRRQRSHSIPRRTGSASPGSAKDRQSSASNSGIRARPLIERCASSVWRKRPAVLPGNRLTRSWRFRRARRQAIPIPPDHGSPHRRRAWMSALPDRHNRAARLRAVAEAGRASRARLHPRRRVAGPHGRGRTAGQRRHGTPARIPRSLTPSRGFAERSASWQRGARGPATSSRREGSNCPEARCRVRRSTRARGGALRSEATRSCRNRGRRGATGADTASRCETGPTRPRQSGRSASAASEDRAD